ncbi:hypothetical protein LCGC14_0475550 [marine sediment metagenome]|uniref:Uncharacterized protein n=1 Tax=marine sediment metagenome TaxID=412755 RepID=A0A0F9STW4_9ZZZZ
MEYKIVCDGKVIARFVNECDRDYALDALAEQFPDSEFVGTKQE